MVEVFVQFSEIQPDDHTLLDGLALGPRVNHPQSQGGVGRMHRLIIMRNFDVVYTVEISNANFVVLIVWDGTERAGGKQQQQQPRRRRQRKKQASRASKQQPTNDRTHNTLFTGRSFVGPSLGRRRSLPAHGPDPSSVGGWMDGWARRVCRTHRGRQTTAGMKKK